MASVRAVNENFHHIIIVCLLKERVDSLSFPAGSTFVSKLPELIMSAPSLSLVMVVPQLPHQHW